MTAEQISEMVQADLATYAVASSPRPTLGIPWPDEKARKSLAALKTCLVTPYAQRFCLKDTVAQMRTSPLRTEIYWVVAKSQQFLQFYDPEKREYGLAMQGRDGALPETIGVRGDLLGVFGAM